MKKANYIGKAKLSRMLIEYIRFIAVVNLIFILCVISNYSAKAMDNLPIQKDKDSISYDQISVKATIEGYGYCDLDVLYTSDDLLFVDVADLFRSLKIPYFVANNCDSITGFLVDENSKYIIDFNKEQITTGDKIFKTQNGLIKEMGTLYMESSLLANAFGITLSFNFRNLAITLTSDFELPFVKELRLEEIRTNISNIKGEVIADTILKRNYHLFRFGMFDWSVSSFQRWNGLADNRIGLGLGTELLFGEADVSLSYYNKQEFDNRQLFYIWRWVDNDKSLIKQAQVGKIYNQTISFLNAPIIGAVIRNSPTTVRKATGYYTINEFTEPNWTVELYINQVLVDYTKADASGLFIFKVPIVYGYTTLKLKFYGPLGEERTDERTINVPYTILPTNEFEYSLSAGVLEDTSRSRFGKADFNYGLNRFITVGGGLEYLSSISSGAYIPYANVTFQPFSKLTFSGEYAHGVRTRGLLNYYFGKSASLEIDYTKYVEGQQATIFNASEERKIRLTLPIRLVNVAGLARFDFMQFVYNKFYYSQGIMMFSAYYKQFSTNSSTQFNWIDLKIPSVTTELSLSYRILKGLVLRSSAQFNINESSFMMCKAEVEKQIRNGYFSVSYANNVKYNDSYINLNFRYDLSFSRINISASHNNGLLSTSESAQGSLAFGGGNNYIYLNNNSSIGKGGILLYPFLDLNNNGIFDNGELMVKLTTARINGGKAIFSEKDSIVRIPDLNAFVYSNIELNDNSLENIAWRFKMKNYQVLVDPNQFKRIDIPIVTMGEISGMVYMNNDTTLDGIGRIVVKFYKKNSDQVIAETMSEYDGYINYMGFEPGDYEARVDPVQLKNLEFTVFPTQINFTIKPLEEGDIVEDINFVLTKKQ